MFFDRQENMLGGKYRKSLRSFFPKHSTKCIPVDSALALEFEVGIWTSRRTPMDYGIATAKMSRALLLWRFKSHIVISKTRHLLQEQWETLPL